MKIAIMQPYYYPYAGYFRLFAATDIFVILDDVQWNRRGRVHRFESKGKWITLPIKKTSRDTTRICDLQWQEKIKEKYCGVGPINLIIGSIFNMCLELKIPFNTIRSSRMNLSDDFRGQGRIIAICKKLGATEYINSPGGRHLYDEEEFIRNGIKLTFLPEYKGSYDSIIERISREKPEDIRKEIYENI
jgi:hypothetical protein